MTILLDSAMFSLILFGTFLTGLTLGYWWGYDKGITNSTKIYKAQLDKLFRELYSKEANRACVD